MPIPTRLQLKTSIDDLLVQVTDDGSRTLLISGTQDAYHSGYGALSETRHVYLQNSGIARRLATGRPSRVLEIGFGTGLGMLVSVFEAMHHNTPLEFHSIENRLVPADVLAELQMNPVCDPNLTSNCRKNATETLVRDFLCWRESLPTNVPDGKYSWQASSIHRLTLWCGDAAHWQPHQNGYFDAIYFDAFAPASCPQLWTPNVFTVMNRSLKPGGSLTTYCVGREVRDTIGSAGFDVTRVPGPRPGKREVLIATKPPQPNLH